MFICSIINCEEYFLKKYNYLISSFRWFFEHLPVFFFTFSSLQRIPTVDPQIPNGGSGIPRHFVALIHRLASDSNEFGSFNGMVPLKKYEKVIFSLGMGIHLTIYFIILPYFRCKNGSHIRNSTWMPTK